MEHVLNRKERTQAFLKFLLFFLLSIIIIVAAFANFNAYVPIKENQMLHNQLEQYKMQSMEQETYQATLDETMRLFDSLNVPNSNIEYVKFRITENLNQLSDKRYNDSSMHSRLNRTVTNVFWRYNEAIFEKLKRADLSEELEKSKAEEKELRDQLRDCRDENAILDSRLRSTGF